MVNECIIANALIEPEKQARPGDRRCGSYEPQPQILRLSALCSGWQAI